MGFESLMGGFASAITPLNLVACLVGSILGTVTGVLPGLGPAAAMALLLPITIGLPPTASVIMLSGIYYGAMYGGSTTSILLNVPGETASVVTCIDGYQMSKKGRAGAALSAAAIGSWVAGTVSILGVMWFAPPLADLALAFGPPEYFAIGILGIMTLNNLTGNSFLKSTIIMLFGLMISTMGMDLITGTPRFTFGIPSLNDGMDLVSIMMGLFGMSEIMSMIFNTGEEINVQKVRFRDLYPTKAELKRCIAPIFRGTAIGFPVGLIPGPGHVISTLISYKVEKGISKHPEQFGHGAIEGVAGPEAANNAASTATMIPLFALGLPFSAATAILLSSLMLHGISPSPLLIPQHPELFWGLIASMYLGNVMLLILNLPLVGVFASIIKLPSYIVMPLVTSIMFIGAYTVKNNIREMIILLVSGIIGYILNKAGYSAIPLIIGLVLGNMMEQSYVQGLLMTDGNFLGFFTRPISGTLLTLTVVMLVWGVIIKPLRNHRKEKYQ